MSSLIEKIFADDKVYDALSSALIGKTYRTSSKGFTNFNCPVCVLRGQPRHDSKKRCSIKYDAEGIGINCFNCKEKLRFKKGQLLSKGMEQFLIALGVPQKKVQELYFWAWELNSLLKDTNVQIPESANFFGFPTVELPFGAKPIAELLECSDANFVAVMEYLLSRGDHLLDATTYYWSPEMSRRLIIPFYYEKRIVGWTARTIDDVKPKYLNNSPNGYLFNCDIIKLDRNFIILTEGIFDALSIDCIGLQTNDINDKKICWLNASKQTKILVPDRDVAGDKLIDIALKQGWNVAFPYGDGTRSNQWWETDIKDTADAVSRYGKLWTLRSIIASSTNNTALISVNRNNNATKRRFTFE